MGCVVGEVNRLVLRAAPDDLATLAVIPFNGCFHNLPYVVCIIGPLDFALPIQ